MLFLNVLVNTVKCILIGAVNYVIFHIVVLITPVLWNVYCCDACCIDYAVTKKREELMHKQEALEKALAKGMFTLKMFT